MVPPNISALAKETLMKKLGPAGGIIPRRGLMLPPRDEHDSWQYEEEVIDAEVIENPSTSRWSWFSAKIKWVWSYSWRSTQWTWTKLSVVLRAIFSLIAKYVPMGCGWIWSGIKWASGHVWRSVQWTWMRLSMSFRMMTGTIVTAMAFAILVALIYGALGSMSMPSWTVDTPSHYLWWGLGGAAALGLGYLLYRAIPGVSLNNAARGGGVQWLLAFAAFHWLLWSIAPDMWNAWRASERFWPMNVGLVLAILLSGQQGQIRYAGHALWVLLVIGIAMSIFTGVPERFRPAGAERTSAVRGLPTRPLPASIALAIIAECESGGRHLDDDGNVVTSETGDVGKWQINVPTHEQELKKLKLDPKVEEDNARFARILYDRESTRPWNASRHCWEPRLAGFARGEEVSYLIRAEPEKWTETFHFPPGMMVDYRGMRAEAQFALKDQARREWKFTPEQSDRIPGILSQAQFRALGDTAEEIHIRLYR